MKMGSLLLATLLGIVTMSCSHKEKKPVEHELMRTSAEDTAEVTNVDYKTRKLTLKTDDGPVTIVAGDEIKNLNQIKKGDLVVAQYNAALVYTIDRSGKAEAPKVTRDTWKAKPGERPQAGQKTELTSTVVVTDINRSAPSITFKNADGEKQTFEVSHPDRLKDVDVGDTVKIKYSEAIALKIEKKNQSI